MPAALSIALVMAAVIASLTPSRREFQWFLALRRPPWLTFERWIPAIWSVIYLCFYASCLIAWHSTSSWGLMLGYLVLLGLVQSYTTVICRSRRLASGTVAGFLGWVWGVAMAVNLAGSVPVAALLLLPFLFWSPVGTFVTWRMQRLNR
jgi:tryptophan-rich sensory protein